MDIPPELADKYFRFSQSRQYCSFRITVEFSSGFQLKLIESSLYQCGRASVHRETVTSKLKGIVIDRHSFCIPNYLRILLMPGVS
jgi:hypothetical protein